MLRGKLPADVRVEVLPADEAAMSDDQKAWNARGTDVYDEVEVKTEKDAHGAPVVTVSVPAGSKPTQRIAFVRTIAADKTVPLVLVDGDTFAKMYAGNPPELAPGEYLRVANSELFQSLNAFFVIGFTPLVILFFGWLTRRGVDFSTARKIFVGMLLTTVSLLLMVVAGVSGGNGEHKVSWFWLVLFYAVITFGELCLSPMALSLVTKLSPRRFVGLTMGGWFLATAFGNNFSGFFGGIQGMMSPVSFFLLLAGLAGLVALYLRLVLPGLNATIQKYGA